MNSTLLSKSIYSLILQSKTLVSDSTSTLTTPVTALTKKIKSKLKPVSTEPSQSLFSPNLKPVLLEDIKKRISLAKTDFHFKTVSKDLAKVTDKLVRDNLLLKLVDSVLSSNDADRAIELFGTNTDLFNIDRLTRLFEVLIKNSKFTDVLKVFYTYLEKYENKQIPVGHLDLIAEAALGLQGHGFEVMKQVEAIAKERGIELGYQAKRIVGCLAIRDGQFEDGMNYIFINDEIVFRRNKTLRGNLRAMGYFGLGRDREGVNEVKKIFEMKLKVFNETRNFLEVAAKKGFKEAEVLLEKNGGDDMVDLMGWLKGGLQKKETVEKGLKSVEQKMVTVEENLKPALNNKEKNDGNFRSGHERSQKVVKDLKILAEKRSKVERSSENLMSVKKQSVSHKIEKNSE